MLALGLLATLSSSYSTGFVDANPYWQPGADLTRVGPAIGPTVFDVTEYSR